MAKRVGVLTPQGEVPSEYIKKSAAHALVRQLLAVWVVENAIIRRIAVKIAEKGPARFVLPAKPYIPEKLPAAEIPGVHFVPPARPAWVNAYSPDACS